MSEEAAKQIDRENLALRVGEAPQLAQGLASDAKIVGLMLPLPLPESSVEALDPALAANPLSQPLLGSLAQELSWQSAMAELLALVRIEGMAVAGATDSAGSAVGALELLLASSAPDIGLEAEVQTRPELEGRALEPATPSFVDTAFGEVDALALSLQDKDLFGLGSGPQTGGQPESGLRAGADLALDFDLFGPTQGLTNLTKATVPTGDPSTVIPMDGGGGSSAASISNSGSQPFENGFPGYIALDKGAANIKLDLNAALMNVDDANNLTIRGDGDDTLVLVGDWFLVSEDPAKSVSVYAYADSPVSVVADNVEVVLA